MSKGSARRPGDIKPGAWEAIFGKPQVPLGNDFEKVLRDNLWDLYVTDAKNVSIPAPKINTSGECVDAVNKTDWSAS